VIISAIFMRGLWRYGFLGAFGAALRIRFCRTLLFSLSFPFPLHPRCFAGRIALLALRPVSRWRDGFAPLRTTFRDGKKFCLLRLWCRPSPGFFDRLGRNGFFLGRLGRARASARAASFLFARVGSGAGGGRRVVVGFRR
jgi:hypothetical protein